MGVHGACQVLAVLLRVAQVEHLLQVRRRHADPVLPDAEDVQAARLPGHLRLQCAQGSRTSGRVLGFMCSPLAWNPDALHFDGVQFLGGRQRADNQGLGHSGLAGCHGDDTVGGR